MLQTALMKRIRKRFRSGTFSYSRAVQLPLSFNRLSDGDDILIGGKLWKVIVGRGHSPEHVSLYCDEIGKYSLPGLSTAARDHAQYQRVAG